MATATKSVREVMVGRWSDQGRKVLELGAAIPEADFDQQPVDGVRTTAEVFRHLAFWNRWVAATAQGGSPDGSVNELAAHEAPTKTAALAAFESSLAEAAQALGAQEEMSSQTVALCAAFVGHVAEHYGQLVVYARLRGIVPPDSR